MADRGLPRLLIEARQAVDAGAGAVLATVIHTAGSTYRKTGARMLIRADGTLAGMLGGGCFDSDLAEQALAVLKSDTCTLVEYDMRSPDDAIWGLGLGCEGLVRIFLQPLDPDRSSILATLESLVAAGGGRMVTIVEAPNATWVGAAWRLGDDAGPLDLPAARLPAGIHLVGDTTVFIESVAPAPVLCVCGAGADALPVVNQASSLGWRVIVFDHRAGHVRPERFPEAHDVRIFDAADPDLAVADAVLVMSHSLDGDQRFLAAMTGLGCSWIGVLGPTARRDRLVELLGDEGGDLAHRLRGPVGLDLGGELPEEVALSIVAELQSAHYERDARPLTGAGRK